MLNTLPVKRWNTSLNPLQHPVRRCTQVYFKSIRDARKRAGDLLYACLDDERLINFSLSYWPEVNQKQSPPDASLNVAYQMLWHFECDMGLNNDGLSKTEAFYTDLQFEMLKQVAYYLSQGRELPPDLLMMYKIEEPTPQFKPVYYNPFIQRVSDTFLFYSELFYSKWNSWTLHILRKYLSFLIPQKGHPMFFNKESKAVAPIKADPSKSPTVQTDAGMTPPSTPRKTVAGEATPNPKNKDYTTAPQKPKSR
jgi:hypothetical protein